MFSAPLSAFFIHASALPWPGLNGLPTAGFLCQQCGMAKAKKNPAAVALGRLGGLRGGKARAASMTAAERSAEKG
jgi:hypothetical protein